MDFGFRLARLELVGLASCAPKNGLYPGAVSRRRTGYGERNVANKIDGGEAEKIMDLAGKYDAATLHECRHVLVKKYHPGLAKQNGLSIE